jgi:hypothetical protein
VPGNSVPKNQPYFDTDTTPLTYYVYDRGIGAWAAIAIPNAPIDATSFQSIAISNASPANGNLLTYSSGSAEYVPT